MSSFTLSRPQVFPEGASVSVYPASNWPNGIVDQSAAPIGSATNTQTVSNGSLTFTGLTDGVKYAAYYNGRYVIFTPGALPFGKANSADLTAEIAARQAAMASGTLAVRAAAATFGVGYYFATDDNGGTLYYSSGSAWTRVAQRGTLLDKVERTSDFTTNSTSLVDVTGVTKTIVGRGRPASVRFECPTGLSANGAGKFAAAQILQDGVEVAFAAWPSYAANAAVPLSMGREVDALVEGQSYVFKVRLSSFFGNGTTDVAKLGAAATSPMTLSVKDA